MGTEICSYETCTRQARRVVGICDLHYQRKRLGVPMDNPIRYKPIKYHNKYCSVEGCIRLRKAWGMCSVHYSRAKLGKELAAPIRGDIPKVWIDNRDGYRMISLDGSPYPEHRRIMEIHLGRKLSRVEVVHHKDHNRINNDISNLELMTMEEHIELHKRDRTQTICPCCLPPTYKLCKAHQKDKKLE